MITMPMVTPVVVNVIEFGVLGGGNAGNVAIAAVAFTIQYSPPLLFCGCPPFIISFILATKLKHKSSAIVLLASTITCSIWYGFCWYGAREGEVVFAIYCLGIVSLPMMLPAWIVVMALNLDDTDKIPPDIPVM